MTDCFFLIYRPINNNAKMTKRFMVIIMDILSTVFIVLSRTCANCSRDSYRNFKIKMRNLFSPAKWWFAMPTDTF